MKLTKKLEAEILKVYKAYWDSYITGDSKTMASIIDDDYNQIGSADVEVFFNKKTALKFINDTIDQVAGKAEMRNRVIKIEPLEELILVNDFFDIYVLIENEWSFYSKLRASTLMQKKKDGWKFIHQHSSMPDTRTKDGENISIEKISAENLQLRQAVKRRTVELENKNRKLEIEASLEKVRAQALGMTKADDLLNVSEILYEELQKLGFDEMRNAMINIHNDEEGTFVNYDYSDEIGKSINHLEYNIHPVIKKQIKKIRSADDAFSETVFKGQDLKSWKAFRKKIGEKDDPRINKSTALYYYFYSIGTGSIGISTFSSIDEEKLSVLKRFRNVFKLSYQRYIDIKQAEAQAKEAQIEASLERVRAVAMSMNKSEDLLSICKVSFKEFKKLGFDNMRNALIHIQYDEQKYFMDYDFSDLTGGAITKIEYGSHPVVEEYVKQIRSAKDAFYQGVIKEDQLEEWKNFRRNSGQMDDPRLEKATALYYYFFSIGIGDIGISTLQPINESQIKILKRFRNVFDLAYRRYTDITKAEAQAKEVQIELALERVRARTMAMQKSDELAETAQVLFQQFSELGEDPDQLSIAIVNESEKVLETWLSVQGNLMKQMFKASIEEPIVINKIYTAWKKKKKSLTIDISGHELERYNNFRNSLNEFKDYNDAKNRTSREENRRVIYVAYFSRGMLAVATPEPRPNEIINLLERFASVFDGTYTRFLDLQKAETQAKEAQIELALERVRARTMAMQKSNELAETAYVLFQQFRELGQQPDQFTIGIMNEDEHVIEFWHTWLGSPMGAKVIFSTDEPHMAKKVFQAWKEQKKSIIIDLSGIELREYNAYRKVRLQEAKVNFGNVLDEEKRRIIYFACFSKGTISISTHKPRPDETTQLLERFAGVFDGTYTRFLDLQKAEAQAREAQIELALERVRARTMAMQKSEELKEVIQVVYDQFVHLNIHVEHTGFIMDYKARDNMHIWLADKNAVPFEVTIPYFDCAHWNSFKEAKEKGINFFANHLTFEEKNKFYQDLFKLIPDVPEETLKYYFSCPGLAISTVLLENVGLYIENFSGIPYSDEENKTLMRFGKVFQQTYTRFLDLQKAEGQAREAQIEVAMEKVRARSLIMQKPEELIDVATVLRKEMGLLGVEELETSSIYIHDEKNETTNCWYAIKDVRSEDKKLVNDHMMIKLNDTWVGREMLKFYKSKDKQISIRMYGENRKEWINYCAEHSKVFKQSHYGEEIPERTYHLLKFSNGYIGAASPGNISAESWELLHRATSVFSLAYTRFLDLQKAEAQAREAQIETALERVRSRTMAMHQSSELAETASVLFKQLIELGIEPNRLYIAIVKDETGKAEFWITDEDGSKVSSGFSAKLNDNSSFNKMFEGWKKKNKSLTIDMEGKELQDYFEHLGKLNVPFKGGLSQKRRVQHIAYFSQGFIGIASPDLQAEETVNLLERFAAVFNLTYRRFLDLQKAEAQARESQIEAALERVRAKAMAMHTSNDLSDTMGVLFTELPKLGISSLRCGVVLLSKDHRRGVFYAAATTSESDSFTMIGGGDMAEHPVFLKQYENWLNNENYFTTLSDEELKSYYKAIFARLSIPYTPREHKVQTEHGYYFSFSEGMFYAWADVPYSEDEINVLNRFKVLIDLTFRRYFDLQKAEAQAREAQIETALERVRSRTMAMQKSDELAEVVAHLFEQLKSLDIKTYRCNLGIVDESSAHIQYWATTNEGKVRPVAASVPITVNIYTKKMYDGWKNQEDIVVIKLLGEERLAWTESVRKYISFTEYLPENIDREKILNEPAILSNFYFKQGFFAIHTLKELNSSSQNIINRFTKVFEQTYTRFLDLQKAEEQAREAKIEASLERVRSKAMAMHSPNDLSETVNVFFKELKTLGIIPIRCGVGQIDEATRTTSLTTTTSSQQGDSFQVIGKVKQTGHPVLDGIFDNWKLQKEYYPVLEGEDIKSFYNVMNPQIGYPNYPEGMTQYGNNFPFKEGFVFAWTESKLSEEELQIFRRFTSVLSLTYRRFIDLKSAEARAFEAVRQASLDRVRAEIASMRTSEDLNHITPIIWRELKNLEVPFFRCGVFIVDENNSKVKVYLTTPDGKSLGVLHLPIDSSELTNHTVDYWRKKQVYKEHWNKEKFLSWTKSMVDQGQVQNATTYQGSVEPPESLDLHFVPFTQGMLYVGDASPLSDEKLQLVKILAEAFSIAYARYEDFINLEEAKNKIEITLSELKSAQAQLIHSEKMASLGELTAGIAHEIKNPLNFVNNFSEVSRELLDEMKVEIQNNNLNDVIGLIEDLKQNLDKINTHGKRADSIVKGMLLHSRGTSGEKVLTNINELLDQYVVLAYHGLRAQDKEFNITIEKDYDDTLEKINVVPQDISRVFLNIVNNACYAANEKKKRNDDYNFSPTLKVSTKNLNGKVEIRIADNGDGIPESFKKQIFNPFFTTKPTGEGTGLGLSLSYDIVTKVHGGDIKVESEEGKYTEFTITIPKLNEA